jgi:hypothetical protein
MGFAWPKLTIFFGIEDVERVEGPLEAAHGGECRLAEFRFRGGYYRGDWAQTGHEQSAAKFHC